MKIKENSLRVNNLLSPVIDSNPFFSWELDGSPAGHQKIYCVTVTRENGSVVWTSGAIESEKRSYIHMEEKTEPLSRYLCHVEITDENGNRSSACSSFRTGKMGGEWQAKWITGYFLRKRDDALAAPYLRKDFTLSGTVKDAMLYICGLGYFVCTINGKRVNEEYLSTPYTDYSKHIFYRAFDVKDKLAKKNAIGVVLGNGFYNCFTDDPWQSRFAPWRDVPKMICELHIEYENGEKEIISSDPTWQSSRGPITFNGIRHGEEYDANLEMPGWDTYGYTCGEGWKNARMVRPAGGELLLMEMEPITLRMRRPAVRMKNYDGKTLFDIGQNQAGICLLTLRGKKGDRITIKYCDLLDKDGKLTQWPLSCFIKNYTFQTEVYTKKSDEPEVWHSEFTYHGFQYAEIDGGDENRQLSDVVALSLSNNLRDRGEFTTSDETINKVQKMCIESTRSCTMNTIASDAVREKTSWIGDAGFSSEQLLINFASEQFMNRWLLDLRDAQTPAGAVPCVVPSTGWGFNSLNGPDWASTIVDSAAFLYRATGDLSYLRENYDMLRRHCSHISQMAIDGIANYGLGDWCAPFEGEAISVNMGSFKCPVAVTDTGYYHTAVRTLARWAKLLGKADDEKKYTALADSIKKAFRSKLYDESTHTVKGNCQTATGVMIYHGLCEKEEYAPLIARLKEQISEQNGHLDFGVLGNKAVFNALGMCGEVRTALELIKNPTFPSYKHWIDMGANTLWECWNGLGSRNHHMFSDVSAFFYKYIGGISADDDMPAYEHIILRPAVGCGIEKVHCSVETSYGKAISDFENDGKTLRLSLTVPSGSHATLFLPMYIDDAFAGAAHTPFAEKLTASGNAVRFTPCDMPEIKADLPSGKYTFTAKI